MEDHTVIYKLIHAVTGIGIITITVTVLCHLGFIIEWFMRK